jgi:hypothetical protein
MNNFVFQVRSLDSHNNQKIVHAYETQELASNAVKMMKKGTRKRYIVVEVPNNLNAHWGVKTSILPEKPPVKKLNIPKPIIK